MNKAIHILLTAICIVSAPVTWSAGGGSMGTPQMSAPRELTPQEKAKAAYNSGVRSVKKAKKAEAAAAKATDERRKEKALNQALELNTRARQDFEVAVANDSSLFDAWNYLGYTHRKLGDFDASLAAYDRALQLKPEYSLAIEYRGETYLALDRLAEAQHAYLDLFDRDRALADELLVAMQDWVVARRATPGDVDPTTVDQFDRWVQERPAPAASAKSAKGW